MKSRIHLLFFIFFPKLIWAQNGCIDSVSFNKYYNQYFNGLSTKPSQRDAADNFYLNAGTTIGGNRYASIIKFNANNQLLWYKNYIARQFFTDIYPAELTAIDNSANLFFTSLGQDIIPLKYYSLFLKALRPARAGMDILKEVKNLLAAVMYGLANTNLLVSCCSRSRGVLF